MKSFSCGQVVPGCQRQFHAESDDEILRQVAQHASGDHGMHEVPADVVDAVRAGIIPVQAS